MISSAALRRAAPCLQSSVRSCRRHISSKAPLETADSLRWGYVASAVCAGTVTYWGIQAARTYTSRPAEAEAPIRDNAVNPNEPILEATRRKGATKEENRGIISSQHLQTKQSWENPGVYAWGLNSGKVVAPDSDERYVKSPRRISFFDGMLLRDIKLEKDFGAAVDEKGDLLLWGKAYDNKTRLPEVCFKGRNLRSISISDDRVVALSENGSVYSIPVSKERQAKEPKLVESSWFWSNSKTNVGCRSLTPTDLGLNEKIVSISGGLEHVLMLTSRGRVFSAASSSADFPRHGQLGVPGLTWYSRPAGPYYQPHEVKALKGITIKQIAAGDTHSMVMDSEGRVFSFGDNAHGQLGLPYIGETMDLDSPLNIKTNIVDIPTQIPIASLYSGLASAIKVKTIAAGGQNSYFTVDSKPIKDGGPALSQISRSTSSSDSSEAWACGRGLWGALGNGKFTHIQWGPTKIPALSGMIEYNETTNKPQPIKVRSFQVGQSHVAAIMDNITSVGTNSRSGANDTNFGADVYFFGNNEHFQLGTGKRANLTVPTHIPALGTASSVVGKDFDRFQLTPAKKITFAGRSVWVEQRVECGRLCSAVYSAAL